MNTIVRVLMERDGMDIESAKEYLEDAREEFYIESEVGKGTHIKMVVNL